MTQKTITKTDFLTYCVCPKDFWLRKNRPDIYKAPEMTLFFQKLIKDGYEVDLVNARRIWYWAGAASLSQLANEGTSKPGECKFPAPVKGITVLQVIEIIPCTEKARNSIQAVAEWRA